MQIVDKGVGNPVCWVTGMVVGQPYHAFTFDKQIEPETPYGPIYLSLPVVEQMAGMLGFLSPARAAELNEIIDNQERDLLLLDDQLATAKADADALRAVVEKWYTTPVEPHAAELKIGQGKPGPGRPKKVLA